MSKKAKVYIASPYTRGRQADNVRRQVEAKHILLDHGYVPFAPLLNHYAEIYRHREEEEWFQWDIEWLLVCDVLVRITAYDENGIEVPSIGADEEVKIAMENDIPVYVVHSIDDLKNWCIKFKECIKIKNKTLDNPIIQ